MRHGLLVLGLCFTGLPIDILPCLVGEGDQELPNQKREKTQNEKTNFSILFPKRTVALFELVMSWRLAGDSRLRMGQKQRLYGLKLHDSSVNACLDREFCLSVIIVLD